MNAVTGQRERQWNEGWSRWRDAGVALPTRWRSLFENPDISFDVEMTIAIEGGRIVCEKFTASRKAGGPPVRNVELREVPIAALLELAAKRVTTVEGRGDYFAQPEDDGGDAGGRADRVIKSLRPSKRTRADKEAVLQDVARIYREAIAVGDSAPRRAIAEKLDYTVGYAAKLVTQARERGFLGPASPGKAGEES